MEKYVLDAMCEMGYMEQAQNRMVTRYTPQWQLIMVILPCGKCGTKAAEPETMHGLAVQ